LNKRSKKYFQFKNLRVLRVLRGLFLQMIFNPVLQSLLLLAVDPKLKGLLVAAGPGFGKSFLIRAYRNLLPDPHIEIPLNVTEDRLLGGVDFERVAAAGQRRRQKGLLSSADKGTVYVDDINLLETVPANQLSAALSAGYINLEREGISEIHSTDFLLIGSYDPDEGEIRNSLLDRVGLFVQMPTVESPDKRVEIIEAALYGNSDEDEFELEILKGLAAEAQSLLPKVEIGLEDRRRLIFAALELGVEGNRADIFAARAARAHAALSGRAAVEEEDLEAAVRFVLAPRATVIPTPEEEEHPEKEKPRQDESEDLEDLKDRRAAVEDLLIKAADAWAPEWILESSVKRQRRSAAGSRGETVNNKRGRHIKSVAAKLPEGKISLFATLRAAATKQRERRSDKAVFIKPEDLRFKLFKQKAGTLFIFVVDASGSMALNRINQAKGALAQLLQKAYVHRDKIALISLRGTKAELMLPPSQSVERAKRAVDSMPVGGGTPIAAGLLTAFDLAKRARKAGVKQTAILIFTDGRANVGLHTEDIEDRETKRAAIREELAQVGAALQYEGIASAVIDTQSRFASSGEGQALARLLGARYVYLPKEIRTQSS
jgi:magnesium chelatase subunit D